MNQSTSSLPDSKHFELTALAAGVYAAIGTAGGGGVSNAGIIDLGDETLIFDAFETPMAAQDLRTAAEHLTGRSATYVVNSHVHADHWGGNQVFADHATIIATHRIRKEMPAAIAWLKELQEDPAELEQEIQEQREQLEAETNPEQRTTIERYVARMEYWLAMFPTLTFCYPKQTFEGKLVFHGTQRTAELYSVAPGHTVSDVYLLLRGERIMFTGDLGFFGGPPFMVYCDPQAWTAWLEEAEQADVEVFVPGHGPLGTKADLAHQRAYITLLEKTVSQAIQEGLSADETIDRSLPAPYDVWSQRGMARWEANVWSAYERLSGQSEG